AAIPVYAVGLGTDKIPQNVRIVDLEAPQRVYPGDEFIITAYVQGSGLAKSSVEIKLFSGQAASGSGGLTEETAQQRTMTLGDDDVVTPVVFKLRPEDQGRREYQVRITTKANDHDPRDNQRSVIVEVVDRKNKVLLFAGGPTREFRFLRNQLHRDDESIVDVLLQTGKPEVSQEANKLLFEFPKTEEDLFGYDCIVAFEPDWEALDEVQVQLLERWIAEKAGGLVVVAGPVHTAQWAGRRRGDKRFDTIKALYPVVFYTTGSAALNLGRTGGENSWPLQFTRDGIEAEFLWLTDDFVTSEAAWQSFGGVFGYFAVKDPKPGAKVFARFADPDTSIDNELPIYLAGHFYGAGRVFFQASGEMWRVRSVDESYFEAYYTKLLRWVSQGRLMQDSSRGVLLVDKERCLLGEQVVVRAMLTDAQRQPLTDAELSLALIQPDGSRRPMTLPLVKDSARAGTYAGQFTTAQLGDYRLELRIPHSTDNELLTRKVRADAPQRETQHPQRNDVLLREITTKTSGQYFVGLAAASSASQAPLANLLEPQDQVTIIPGTPDRGFDRLLMSWLLGTITGALCLEWLLRRLSRLA
ncbi:MAG TPA: VWA domain-containing protein, partial [Pirellulaceae bacterium]|nr:VWA domain-containing protein [Pirellulaceae bacterium]